MTIPGFASDHGARERALLDSARGGDKRAPDLLLAEHAMRKAVLTAWRERALDARLIIDGDIREANRRQVPDSMTARRDRCHHGDLRAVLTEAAV